MLRKFWMKYRAILCFAFGILCFMTAGLMVRALPSYRERIMAREAPPVQVSEAPAPEAASASAGENGEETPEPRKVVRRSAGTRSGVEVLSPENGETDAAGGAEPAGEEWYLYITGSVRKPGVYKLPAGARLFQLVDAAGGLNNLADPVAVNLAALLEDGMHVHVPKKGEEPPEDTTIFIEPTVVPPVLRPTPRGGPVSRAGLLDINSATTEELTKLRGIGPALAKNIVSFRQRYGRFGHVDDLLRVRGIGSAKLEGFRDSVTARP